MELFIGDDANGSDDADDGNCNENRSILLNLMLHFFFSAIFFSQ